MKSVILKKREADGTSGTSGRYESSPLIAIYYDWTIVFFVGRANDLLSATGEINPSLTLSVLMLGGKSDKGNGAQWDKEESLTHLLTWWSTAAICPYLRRAGAMAEAHWPTEGSRGLQSWRGHSEVKNKTPRLTTTFNNPHCLHVTSQILTPHSCYVWALIINLQCVWCSYWYLFVFCQTIFYVFLNAEIRREWGLNCRALVMAECVFDSTSWWETNSIYSHYMQSRGLQALASSPVMTVFPCGM